MSEQLGTKLVGSTTFKKLFRSTLAPTDIVPCTLRGANVATYLMGSAMIDDLSYPGTKKKYTNSGGGLTGCCILMNDYATTATGGNVSADACRDGSVDKTMVLDANGALVDSNFTAMLPKVSFD